jgi:hypothetical protein
MVELVTETLDTIKRVAYEAATVMSGVAVKLITGELITTATEAFYRWLRNPNVEDIIDLIGSTAALSQEAEAYVRSAGSELVGSLLKPVSLIPGASGFIDVASDVGGALASTPFAATGYVIDAGEFILDGLADLFSW